MATTSDNQKLNDVKRIVGQTSWTPAERLTAIALIVKADGQPVDANGDVVMTASSSAVASWTGLSKNTTLDALAALKSAGVIRRNVETVHVNRFGEVIPPGSANYSLDDRYESSVTLFVPQAIPDKLPDKLAEPKNRARTRVISRARADELVELRKIAATITCPSCGVIGEWSLKCANCDEVLPLPPIQPAADTALCGPTQSLGCEETRSGVAEGIALCGETQSLVRNEERTNDWFDPHNDEPATEPATEYYLAGSDTIIHLADEGAAFCFVEPHGKKAINPRDDFGAPMPWPDNPVSADAARAHLTRAGNVGLLGGYNSLAVIDVDAGAPDLLQAWPDLAGCAKAYRVDAPDRGKFVIRVDGPMPASKTYEGNGRKCEVLAAGRQAVVAGTHASGADIRFKIAPLLVVTAAQVDDVLTRFVGIAPKAVDPLKTIEPYPPSVSSVSPDYRELIFRWCKDATNQREVDTLLKDKRSGQYYAIRPDDTRPSLRLHRVDEHGRRLWHDFGTGQNFDDLELYCLLGGHDKRAVIREMLGACSPI